MAWLHATPRPPEGSKAADPKFQRKRGSRADEMKAKGIAPPMPPNPLPSLVSHLLEIGLSEAAGMGAAPVSWTTIEAWQRVSGVTLAPWEARTIRGLSVEYLAESRKAESETCPAPWRGEVRQAEQNAELAELRAALG